MLPVRIASADWVLPGEAISTERIASRLSPPRDPQQLKKRSGVHARHHADEDQTCAGLGAQALRAALEGAQLKANDLERLIFVCSHGGDQRIPANANLVLTELGVEGSCDAFDMNNACMGFLSALDVGARSIATGMGPVGIVVSELLSRHISPEDPRPYSVLADGVAAIVLDRAQGDEGLLGVRLRNHGPAGGSVRLAGPSEAERATIRFADSNKAMTALALEAVKKSAAAALAQAELSLSQIDWVLPHQPNGVLYDRMLQALRVPSQKTLPIAESIGSVGAASIPISLAKLLKSGALKPGQRVLLIGVGAGLSYGAIIYQASA